MKFLILILTITTLAHAGKAEDYAECIEEQIFTIEENEDGKTKEELLEEMQDIILWCQV